MKTLIWYEWKKIWSSHLTKVFAVAVFAKICAAITLKNHGYSYILYSVILCLEGGEHHVKTEMEPEYHLHIRAIARESATHLLLRPNHGGGTYGLWQNNGSELVSGAPQAPIITLCWAKRIKFLLFLRSISFPLSIFWRRAGP